MSETGNFLGGSDSQSLKQWICREPGDAGLHPSTRACANAAMRHGYSVTPRRDWDFQIMAGVEGHAGARSPQRPGVESGAMT
jgi:hypothetical protein